MAAGVCFGVCSAAVYLGIECAAIALAPHFGLSKLAAPRFSPGYLVLLASLGLGLGAALGAALGGIVRGGVVAWTTLAVVLAHAAHLVRVSLPSRGLALALGACALVAAVLLTAALRGERAPRLRGLANPWSASLLAVGASLLLLESPGATTTGRALLWIIGVALLVLALDRVAAALGATGPLRPVASLAAGIATLLLGAGLALRPPSAESLTLPAPPRDVPDRPDVVLITLDTVRSDHLSVYGYPRDTSPRLEEFARGATLYTRAVAASNLTLASHASLFTGLYARHHGARIDRRLGAVGLSKRARTLGEIFREAGYLTLAVIGNPAYLGSKLGFAQGFDHFDETDPAPFYPHLRRSFASASLQKALARWVPPPDPTERADAAYRRAEEINRVVFRLLEGAAERSQPIFLFVNYMDAHWPYDPPAPFDDRYPGRLEDALRPRSGGVRGGVSPATHAQPRPMAALRFPVRRRAGLSRWGAGQVVRAAALPGSLGRYADRDHLRPRRSAR